MSTTTSGPNPNTPPEPEGSPVMSAAEPTPPPRVKAGLIDPTMFLTSIPDEGRRADARIVCDILARVTGESPSPGAPPTSAS